MNFIIKECIKQIKNGEVPEGYKKTKCGILPANWKVKKLKDVLQKQTQKNANGKVKNVLTNSATYGVISQTDYFDKQIANEENTGGYYIVRKGYFVYNPRISASAPCGPFNKYYGEKDGVMSPLYTVYRYIDSSEYYSEYLARYFSSSNWHSYMNSIANYGARSDRMNVTTEDMYNMPLPYPPLAEQEKISKILELQDKIIELQQKKVDEYRKLKKAMLQRMFPKKGENVPQIRFPEFTDAWEQRKVGELLIERNEQAPKSVEYPLMAFIANKGIAPKGERYDRSALINDAERKMYKKTEKDDFIYSSNNLDVGAIGLNKYGKASISPVYSIFTTTELADSDFIGRCFVRKDFINKMLKWRQGVIYGQWKIHEVDFMKIKVFLPSVVEQRKIGCFMDHLDNLITLHQRKLDEYKTYKKSLMQLLLTGIVRLKYNQEV